jgi:hypothetical protein
VPSFTKSELQFGLRWVSLKVVPMLGPDGHPRDAGLRWV